MIYVTYSIISFVMKVHCRVINSFEDEFVKYGLFGFMFSFFTFM